MKIENLKDSFNDIKPDESAKIRMLKNIIDCSTAREEKIMKTLNFKKAIPAMALVLVVAGTLFAYNLVGKRGNYYNPPGDFISGDSTAREDAIAPLLNQFQMDGKHYILLSDDLRASFGLPAEIVPDDIGDRIATISKSPDSSLMGSDVYSYLPAGSEAVVAVKKDNEYLLFNFFTFESYNNNQDEDAIEYLKLYGINSAEDILKVQFIVYSEQSKLEGRTDISGEITNRDEIEQFYNYYSVLKNSSDKYFDKLFNFSHYDSGKGDVKIDPRGEVPPDSPVAEDLPLMMDAREADIKANDTPVADHFKGGMVDRGDTGFGSTEPSVGSSGNALSNLVNIRIYNKNGVYYDSPYYVNIGFISRYEINEKFADFIASYTR